MSKIRISDHAIVRYLERVRGIDMNAIRREIITPEREKMILAGARRIKLGGAIEIRMDGLTVCTVADLKEGKIMRPQQQLIKHDPPRAFGDCFRTCIAVILDLPAEEVPHFYETGEFNSDGVVKFLAGRNLAEFQFAYDKDMEFEKILKLMSSFGPGIPMILTGQSRIAPHCVVIMDGKIVCDPSGNGIVGPTKENGWWISVLARKG